MNYQGKIKQWNDKKGFGFIQEEQSASEIFAHISAFHVTNPRPKISEEVSFEIITHADGKKAATNIRRFRHGIELTESSPNSRQSTRTAHSHNVLQKAHIKKLSNAFGNIFAWLVIVVGGYFIYTNFLSDFLKDRKPTELINQNLAPIFSKPTQNFQCDGRTSCPQMRSCDEAQYFIRHCPNTQMDGDNDGIPCEKQWCY